MTDFDEVGVEEENIRVVQCYAHRRALPFYRARRSAGFATLVHINTNFYIFIFVSKCVTVIGIMVGCARTVVAKQELVIAGAEYPFRTTGLAAFFQFF